MQPVLFKGILVAIVVVIIIAIVLLTILVNKIHHEKVGLVEFFVIVSLTMCKNERIKCFYLYEMEPNCDVDIFSRKIRGKLCLAEPDF